MDSIIDKLADKIGLKKPYDSQAISIGGFGAFALISETVKCSNTVPTTTLEDGSTVGDDIIENPTELTIKGFVADTHYLIDNFPQLIGRDFSKVGDLTGLLTNHSQATLQKMARIDAMVAAGVQFGERIERGGRNVGSFLGIEEAKGKGNLELFQLKMNQILTEREPIKISTPSSTWENMAVQTLDMSTESSQGLAVEFSMSLIQINFAELGVTEVKAPAVQKRYQGAVDKGTQVMIAGSEKDVPITSRSMLYDFFS